MAVVLGVVVEAGALVLLPPPKSKEGRLNSKVGRENRRLKADAVLEGAGGAGAEVDDEVLLLLSRGLGLARPRGEAGGGGRAWPAFVDDDPLGVVGAARAGEAVLPPLLGVVLGIAPPARSNQHPAKQLASSRSLFDSGIE